MRVKFAPPKFSICVLGFHGELLSALLCFLCTLNMECLCARGTVRCGFEEQWSCIHVQSKHIPFGQSFMAPRNLGFLGHSSLSKSRSYAIPGVKFPSLHFHREKQSRGSISAYVNVDDVAHLSIPEEPSEELLPQKPDSDQLKALLIDSERRRLIKKLSEANQHNRFLKRQLQAKDDDLVEIKSELAILELEIEALVELAEEVASYGIQPGSRKINGKYVQSHLVSRLEVIQEKFKKHIKDVEAIKFREITLYWIDMAESVRVMGSFDGWSQGEEMSQEYTGAYVKFSANLKLRPGRYEVKFLVDGEWRLSPELPTVGEGLMENNILIVE